MDDTMASPPAGAIERFSRRQILRTYAPPALSVVAAPKLGTLGHSGPRKRGPKKKSAKKSTKKR